MGQDATLLELEQTRAALRASQSELAAERELRARREAELAERAAEAARLVAENAVLKARVDWFARRMFGRSSEKIDPRQLLLAFEAAQAEATADDSLETAAGEETEATPPRPRRSRPSKRAPDLPVVVEQVEPPEAKTPCEGCGGERARIGEDVSELFDYVPATFHVVRTVRGRWACPKCRDAVHQAPPPDTAAPRGIAGPGLVAQILTSKYADHVPLHRQEGIYERSGLFLSRTTMRDVVAAAAESLAAVADAIVDSILEGRVVHTDDTPVTYLTPPKGSATGYVWAYVGERDEAAFDFTEGRSRDGPLAFLAPFKGFLQADAYAGYDAVYERGDVVEVGCWAHARRHFVDAAETDRAAAEPVIALIQRVYAVEREAKEMTEPERRSLRLERSRPILNAIKARVDATPVALPKGPLAKAVGYVQKNWTALTRHLDEGYLSIDNNRAERALRPVAVGRKNWLFAGTLEAGKRAATLMTIVESCKMQRLDPFAYLKDVLVRVRSTSADRMRELTPRAWKVARDAAAAKPTA